MGEHHTLIQGRRRKQGAEVSRRETYHRNGGDPLGWQVVADAPVPVGETMTVTQTIAAQARFYRLRHD